MAQRYPSPVLAPGDIQEQVILFSVLPISTTRVGNVFVNLGVVEYTYPGRF